MNSLCLRATTLINFVDDPFYSNGFIPTVKELVDRLHTGN